MKWMKHVFLECLWNTIQNRLEPGGEQAKQTKSFANPSWDEVCWGSAIWNGNTVKIGRNVLQCVTMLSSIAINPLALIVDRCTHHQREILMAAASTTGALTRMLLGSLPLSLGSPLYIGLWLPEWPKLDPPNFKKNKPFAIKHLS